MRFLSLLKRSLLGQILFLVFATQVLIFCFILILQNQSGSYTESNSDNLESQFIDVLTLVEHLYHHDYFSDPSVLDNHFSRGIVFAWDDINEKNPNFWIYIESSDKPLAKMGKAPIGVDALKHFQTLGPAAPKRCATVEEYYYLEENTAYTNLDFCGDDEYLYVEVGGLSETYTLPFYLHHTIIPPSLNFQQILLSFFGVLLLMPLMLFFLLRPIRRTSKVAGSFVFGADDRRLPTKGLHSEISGLVESVNIALSRLEQGFTREQRLRSAIAHELRTPLTVLRARLDDVQDETLRENLIGDTRKIIHLIERILEFSRVAGVTEALPGISLVAAIRSACADCTMAAMDADIEMKFTHNKMENTFLKIHPMAIELIFTNLINNAIIHAESGGKIHIHVAENSIVNIRDFGPGLPDVLLASLNNSEHVGSYEQVQSRNGIGLVIVTELVRLLGCAIYFENHSGDSTGLEITVKL